MDWIIIVLNSLNLTGLVLIYRELKKPVNPQSTTRFSIDLAPGSVSSRTDEDEWAIEQIRKKALDNNTQEE